MPHQHHHRHATPQPLRTAILQSLIKFLKAFAVSHGGRALLAALSAVAKGKRGGPIAAAWSAATATLRSRDTVRSSAFVGLLVAGYGLWLRAVAVLRHGKVCAQGCQDAIVVPFDLVGSDGTALGQRCHRTGHVLLLKLLFWCGLLSFRSTTRRGESLARCRRWRWSWMLPAVTPRCRCTSSCKRCIR